MQTGLSISSTLLTPLSSPLSLSLQLSPQPHNPTVLPILLSLLSLHLQTSLIHAHSSALESRLLLLQHTLLPTLVLSRSPKQLLNFISQDLPTGFTGVSEAKFTQTYVST